MDIVERQLVKKLMKTSEKQPWIIVFLIIFLSMRKPPKKETPPLKDEAYWRHVGGL